MIEYQVDLCLALVHNNYARVPNTNQLNYARVPNTNQLDIRSSFITTTVLEQHPRVPGHTTRVLPVGFKLAINCIQFYVIANLGKTPLIIQRDKMCPALRFAVPSYLQGWVELQYSECCGTFQASVSALALMH